MKENGESDLGVCLCPFSQIIYLCVCLFVCLFLCALSLNYIYTDGCSLTVVYFLWLQVKEEQRVSVLFFFVSSSLLLCVSERFYVWKKTKTSDFFYISVVLRAYSGMSSIGLSFVSGRVKEKRTTITAKADDA